MAAPNETKVIISGENSGVIRAINETKAAFASASTQMSSAFAPLTGGVTKLQGALGALAGLLAGGAMFKASIAAANDWNSQVGQIAKAMGTSTEKASVMAVALDHLGISSETVAKASLAMAKQLSSNEEAFTALGVQTRNLTTGALLPAGEIMAQVNTRLAGIKNGVEQNIAGMSVYGKAWAEVRGIVRLTTEELARADERAKALGLIVGPEAVAQSKQYKEAQRDLALVSKSLEIQVGQQLLPTMVRLGAWLGSEGPGVAKTFSVALQGVVFAGQATWLALKQVGNTMAALSAIAAELLQGNVTKARGIAEAFLDDSKKIGKSFVDLVDQFGKPLAAEEDVAARRKRLQTDLQTALANLETLRGIASGKISQQIVEDDEKATKARIANAEKLHGALMAAWQGSLEGARKASAEATALLDKATQTRATGAEKAAEIRRGQLPKADQDAANLRDFRNLSDAAVESALLAKMAAQHGRIDAAAKLADQATKDAERAQKFADKLDDPEQQARAAERIADAQATADEARAKIKQQEASNLEDTAKTQAEKINELEAQIVDLQAKAGQVAIKVQIDQALQSIATIRSELDGLQDKTVTVTVNTVGTGAPAPSGGNGGVAPDDLLPGLASGGYTGDGSKWQPAGIVHAGEFVLRQEVVRQRGMLAILHRLNREGLAALPGFASGGLVNYLSVGSVRATPAAQRAAAVFNFPDLGSFPVTMDADPLRQLESAFARVALQKGGRR